MKEKDLVKLDQPDEKQNTQDKKPEENQGVAKKASLAVFLLVILLFAGVMLVTYFFELKFGKTAGTVALIITALIIAGYLYRKEIVEKIKRKK